MTTQPDVPEVAALPARPALRLAGAPDRADVDFDSFVRTYETRLRRLVMRRIGDSCEAEEITQETLLRAYQHRASFGSEDELMAWSTVVAQRLVIDRVRVRGRSVAVAAVPETARLGRDTAEIVVARHEARAALESLEAIPTRQAAILWAREVEGLHYDEIADRFGITEPAVRSLLHRGRRALRKEFKERTGSLPLNGLVPFAPWLLALKAAGKVRVAAKAVAKSSMTTATALSITALVAVGIGGIAGIGTGRAPDARIATAPGGATLVRNVTEPTTAVAKVTATSVRTVAATSHATVRPAGTTPAGAKHVQACLHTTRHGVCGSARDDIVWKGATIQVGPDLPDNPTGLGNVKLSSEEVDCQTTHLPSSGLVTCTQNGPSRTPTNPSPSAPEGVTR